jgi:uncharacterized oligopeptide transporter (OPT) family protein
VAMMTVASLITFFARPQILVGAFSRLVRRRQQTADVLRNIELPLWVSALGIPLLGAGVVVMASCFFGVAVWLSIVAVLLVFIFCLIAINSTGLTSITPIGPMGKLTQLTFGILAPRNIQANLATASITGEVASHSANLLQDIKPGYMLGAKPRQQAVGHVLGVLAGAVLSVPVFYLVFLKVPWGEVFDPALTTPYHVDTKTYAMPSATLWEGVARLLTQGIENLPISAQIAALIGIGVGVIFELLRMRTKNRFPLSPVGIGLGFVIQFYSCLSMFAGAFVFWLLERLFSNRQSRMNQVFVQNMEPICAGLIAGGALMGIAASVAELFLEPH